MYEANLINDNATYRDASTDFERKNFNQDRLSSKEKEGKTVKSHVYRNAPR